MYRLKVNGNYNVLINDISVYVSPTLTPVITQEQLDNSVYLKTLVANGTVIVSEDNGTDVVSNDQNQGQAPIYQDGFAFIKGEQPIGNPPGVFVAMPKGIGDEDVIVAPKLESVVEETIVAPTEEVETQPETIITTQSVEEAEVVKSVESTDASAKIGRNKKNKN